MDLSEIDFGESNKLEYFLYLVFFLITCATLILNVWLIRKLWNRWDLPLELENKAFATQNLTEAESILLVGRFHEWIWQFRWIAYVLAIFSSVVSTAIALFADIRDLDHRWQWLFYMATSMWLLLIFRAGYYNRMYKAEFVLTDKRLITKKGFWQTAIREIPLQKIESVDYGQIFLESWINVGRLTVRGTGGGKVGKFTFLIDALDFRNRILDEINKASE